MNQVSGKSPDDAVPGFRNPRRQPNPPAGSPWRLTPMIYFLPAS